MDLSCKFLSYNNPSLIYLLHETLMTTPQNLKKGPHMLKSRLSRLPEVVSLYSNARNCTFLCYPLKTLQHILQIPLYHLQRRKGSCSKRQVMIRGLSLTNLRLDEKHQK